MTALGVFRDDFYNSSAVLPASQYNTTAVSLTGAPTTPLLFGAVESYLFATAAATITTDSAINIIAYLQNVLKVPNPIGCSFVMQVLSTAGGVSFVGGTGVTVQGDGTASAAQGRNFVATITSATTINIVNLGKFSYIA